MGETPGPETAAGSLRETPLPVDTTRRDLDRGSREVRGAPGLWVADALGLDTVLRRIIDRALTALATSMSPEAETDTGVWKPKRMKRRDTEQALSDQLLRLLSQDFGLRAHDGWNEAALRTALLELGVLRGVFRTVDLGSHRHYETPPRTRLTRELIRGEGGSGNAAPAG